MEAFNGNFYTKNGEVRNIDGGIPANAQQRYMTPFNGKFIGSDGEEKWLEDYIGGGGGTGPDPNKANKDLSNVTNATFAAKAVASGLILKEDPNGFILEMEFDDATSTLAWVDSNNNYKRLLEGSLLRTRTIDEPDFKATWNDVQKRFVAVEVLPTPAHKITTEAGSNVQDELDGLRGGIASAASSTYSAAVAYVDTQIKDFDSLLLYLNNTGISTTQPTAAGVLVPCELTPTEQLWFTRKYTIEGPGVVDKNVYTLMLPFSSLSTSRITTCRAEWKIVQNGITKIIFDKEFRTENTTSDYDYEGDFIREYPTDIPYTDGEVIFTLYGRINQGTDTAYVLLGDKDRTATLIRKAPVSTLSTNKIIYPGNGENKMLTDKILELEARLAAVE